MTEQHVEHSHLKIQPGSDCQSSAHSTLRMATKKAQKGSELVKSRSETLSHSVFGPPEETLENFKIKSV